MKRTILIMICVGLLNSLPLSAQWTKVYGTNVNNTIVYEMIIHQGSFYAATNGRLLRSDDKGETWNSAGVPASGVAAVESDGLRLYAGSIFSFSGISIFYSDDKGETWSESDLSAGQVTEITVVNSNLVYAYSSSQKFYQSTDKGETWTEITHFPFSTTRSIYKSNSGRLYVSGFYSDDDGQTWNETSFLNGTGIYSYGENSEGLWAGAGKLYLTKDAGITWEERSVYLTASLIVDGNNIFQGKEGFAYSTDGGATFTDYDEGITNIDRVLSMLFDGEYIVIGMDGPGIYKIKASELGITTSIEREESLSTDYVLNQNYPNPFNPTTTIKFSIPKQDKVTLKIYDLLGKEIATLVNNELNAGSYSVEFDAVNVSKNLSSGIYLYTLKTKNSSHTKKLMLLK